MKTRALKYVWLIIGLVAVACGVIGVILPLVPTTPFLLLAVFAFARSSPSLQNWLLSHPRLGPPIEDWHKHGAIRGRTKVIAVAVMLVMLSGSWIAGLQPMLVVAQAIVLAAAALFILSRPAVPNHRN